MSYLHAVLSRLRRQFARSFIDRQTEREREKRTRRAAPSRWPRPCPVQRVMAVGSSSKQTVTTRWLVDSHISHSFGWESGTNHVEKATFVTSGSLFSENLGRIKLSFGTGMKKYLVNRMPVFWGWEFWWFGVNSSLNWTRSRPPARSCLPCSLLSLSVWWSINDLTKWHLKRLRTAWRKDTRLS